MQYTSKAMVLHTYKFFPYTAIRWYSEMVQKCTLDMTLCFTNELPHTHAVHEKIHSYTLSGGEHRKTDLTRRKQGQQNQKYTHMYPTYTYMYLTVLPHYHFTLLPATTLHKNLPKLDTHQNQCQEYQQRHNHQISSTCACTSLLDSYTQIKV